MNSSKTYLFSAFQTTTEIQNEFILPFISFFMVIGLLSIYLEVLLQISKALVSQKPCVDDQFKVNEGLP